MNLILLTMDTDYFGTDSSQLYIQHEFGVCEYLARGGGPVGWPTRAPFGTCQRSRLRLPAASASASTSIAMVLQLLQAWYEELTTPDPKPSAHVPAVRAAIASMPFMIHVVVSAFALVIFTVLSSLFSVSTPGVGEFIQAMRGGKGGSKGGERGGREQGSSCRVYRAREARQLHAGVFPGGGLWAGAGQGRAGVWGPGATQGELGRTQAGSFVLMDQSRCALRLMRHCTFWVKGEEPLDVTLLDNPLPCCCLMPCAPPWADG